jgi:methylmalonyl-CoA carboxyltransferase small subunit
LKLQIGIDEEVYEVEVEVLEEDTAPRYAGYIAQPGTATITSMPVASAPKPAAPADANVDESKVCRSPVAGVVVRVDAQPGQKLQENDLLLVLEAMKMETNVVAPTAGTVKAVNVKPGDGVQLNQILAEFE